MKKQENTIVPRHEQLNEQLVVLGHKVHKDERKRALEREKYAREKREWLEDEEWDE